jgi:hypothetical protein
MAIGPERVEPIKPVSEMVARPEAAPNYVGMYSEAIKGALAPYQYLLDYRKELSEEDERRAQIQNFLDEHDLKTQELAETHREHVADEAQKHLDYLQQGKKLDEDVRHNQADEATAKLEADVRVKQEQVDQQRADEEERYHDLQQIHEENALEETIRDNKAKNQVATDDQATKAKVADADISQKGAQAARDQAEADQRKLSNDNFQSDMKVMSALRDGLKKYGPKDFYNMDDNPDLQSMVQEANSKLLTNEGRHQWDMLVGQNTAVGMELQERADLAKMSPEAKKAFHDTYINTDKNDQPANRFNAAMSAANMAQSRYEAKNQWLDQGWKAYNDSKLHAAPGSAAGDIENNAWIAGQSAHMEQMGAAKEKKPVLSAQMLQSIKDAVKRTEGNNMAGDQAFNQRQARIAARIGLKVESGDLKGAQSDMNTLFSTGDLPVEGVPKANNAGSFFDRFFNKANQVTPQGTTSAPPITSTTTGLAAAGTPLQPVSMQSDTGQFVLPGMTRGFQSRIDSGGASVANLSGGGEEEEEGGGELA